MITTSIIGQILGFTFLVISLSMIFNRRNTALVIDRLLKDPAIIWLFGFFSLLFGTTLLTFSNFDRLSSTLITIIGILSYLKGIFLLCFPSFSLKLTKKIIKRYIYIFVAGIVLLALSILLIIISL